MTTSPTTLYYLHDPMCSWCWGFRSTWLSVLEKLDNSIPVHYLLGGLAPDSAAPMPQAMQVHIRDNWKNIQQTIPGTEFNYDFWTRCQPRRSTYPACRAVIATRLQQPALATPMILAIQTAYYLKAKNPSDNVVLIELAHELDLDTTQFTQDITSHETQQLLLSEIRFCRELGVSSFPSVVLKRNETVNRLQVDYNDPDILYRQIKQNDRI